MRKIDVRAYEFTFPVESEDGSVTQQTGSFDPREKLPLIVLSPAAGLGPAEALAMDRICQRIRAAEQSIGVEEEEWKLLCDVLRRLHGFTWAWLPTLRRIFNAPEGSLIDVAEVPEP